MRNIPTRLAALPGGIRRVPPRHVTRRTALVVLILITLPLAALGGGQKKKAAAKAKAPKGLWQPLAEANKRWVLSPTVASGTGARITVETYDARTVGAAKVARLRWAVTSNGASDPLGNDLPGQVAVTKKGIWFLDERLDDAGVKKALKGAPTWSDPPALGKRKDGSYARLAGDQVCIGRGIPPGGGACADGVCHAEFCLLAGTGVVGISGNYTPDAAEFAAPLPGKLGDLATGIPECDEFILKYKQCVEQHFPADTQVQTLESMSQWAAAFREAAKDPDQKAAMGAQCQQLSESMKDATASMGCTW